MIVECTPPGAGAGSGPVGSMPFGSMTPTGVDVSSARAISGNSVLVEFMGGVDDYGSGVEWDSPLNPANWSLVPIDPDARVRLAQHVELHSQTDDGGSFIVYFDGVLTAQRIYEIRLNLLVAELTGCSGARFYGLTIADSAKPVDERDEDGFLRDIANPFLARDVVRIGVSPVGTYQITDQGDLALDGGQAGLRKRLFRRITTAANGFLHLNGYGLLPGMKKLITPDVAGRLSSMAKAQALKEPEVASVTVTVTRVATAPNVLSLLLRVRTQNGEPLDVVVPIVLP